MTYCGHSPSLAEHFSSLVGHFPSLAAQFSSLAAHQRGPYFDGDLGAKKGKIRYLIIFVFKESPNFATIENITFAHICLCLLGFVICYVNWLLERAGGTDNLPH